MATPQPEWTIRPYEPADWPAICAVHDRSRPDELRGSCDPRAFVPLAEDTAEHPLLERSRKFVACVGQEAVGFVAVDDAYVAFLYVDPAFYGRGIGRALLRLGMNLAGPDCWTIALAGNQRALGLYRSEGFRVVATFEGENAGYPCTCVRLALGADPYAAKVSETGP